VTSYVTDYEFPADWEALSPEEKSDWFTQDRCRRQAMRQDTAFAANVEVARRRRELRLRFRQFVKIGFGWL
jgi:hypothetical protein